MPVEITIQVVNRMDGVKASMNRVYFLEDLLFEPQAHIKIWNDIVMMSEDVQKPPSAVVNKTSEQWYNEIYPNKEVIILDPDGWDRKNWDFSWGEEKVTKEEFNRRLCLSTLNNIKSM